MTVAGEHDSEWNLERRASKGFLVWKKDESKVHFRFEVDVLEYEKDPDEHKLMHENESTLLCPLSVSSLSSSTNSSILASIPNTVIICATCAAAIAVTLFVPWYLVGYH